MKRFISAILSMLTLAVLLSGCHSDVSSNSEKLNIVATIYPEYDWVKNITANTDHVEATLLLDKGVDLHSYQPTADDIMKISTCDMFIYVGGESDKWVDGALKEAVNKDMVVINLLDVLGDSAKEEEEVEGMQTGEDADKPELDEHVWLSLKNAKLFCQTICDKLVALDAEHQANYVSAAETYIRLIEETDAEYQKELSGKKYDTLLFGDRFPFRYLVDDYDIKYYAAFSGCSAETEASFETIAFLAGKLDELELPAVMTIDGSDGKIAQTIIDTSHRKNAQVLTLNSMQSGVSFEEENYLGIMKNNLKVLVQALKE